MTGTTPPAVPDEPSVTIWRRKTKPLEVMHWDGSAAGATAIIDWMLANGGTARYHADPPRLRIDLPRGTVDSLPGDRIIKAEDGTFRPLDEPGFFSLLEPAGVAMSGDAPGSSREPARTFGAVAAKPCGCGPDEPCDVHAEKHPPVVPPTATGQPQPHAGADEREPLGRLVHDTRLAHEADQAAAEGRARFVLGAWEERAPSQRELDMRIGSAVAAEAAHQYEAERNELILARMSRSATIAQVRAYCRRRADLGDPAEAKVLAHILGIIGGEEETGDD